MDIFSKLFASQTSPDSGEDPPYYAPIEAGDYATAFPLLQQAMRQEDAHAMGVFAALVAMGRGIDQDPEEASAWFRQAAVRGDLFSQTAFGVCLATGFGVKQDISEAAFWLYRAGEAGHRTAILCLGDLALRDSSIIGKHFSQEQLRALLGKVSSRPAKLH